MCFKYIKDYLLDILGHIKHRFSQNPKRHNYFGLQLRKNQ